MKGIKKGSKVKAKKTKNGAAYSSRARKPEGWDDLSPTQKFIIGVLR
tara:strand:+ start:314 stop:454 length:141 start_codon:yes stop_codon:yes gene_type:complete